MEFDVAGRLAEAVAAVNNTQIYVQACRLRGYHHPDLTEHGAQIADWLRTEEGLDLRLLDVDCATLRSVARYAADGLECVRTQTAALDAAWDGEGGGAAADFLRRHAESAARVVAAAETAAATAERLRDELWRIVGDKVATTVSIDDRTSGQRTPWLTAARAVLAGGEVAEEAIRVVDDEITPYVSTAIAGEWLPAMRESLSALGSVYRQAGDAVAARTGARFDIPGDLGPRAAAVPTPATLPSAVGVAAAPMTVPAAAVPAPSLFSEPVTAAASPTLPAEPASPPVPPMNSSPVVPQPDPLGSAMPSVGGMPTGLPDPLSGAAGLPGRLAETLGSLFDAGSAPGASTPEPDLPDPPKIPEFEPAVLEEEPLDEEPREEDADDEDNQDAEDAAEENVGVESVDELPAAEEPADGEAAAPEATDAPAADCPESDEAEPAEPAVPPPPPPPAVDPAATPCEIAADELPQVGE